MIGTALDKPSVLDVLSQEGIPFRRRGNRAVALCPLHGERTPSFTIFPDGHAHCFGCGFSGDSIALVQALHDIGFKGACAYLGLSLDDGPEARRLRAEARRKREAVERFQEWRSRRMTELFTLIRTLDQRKLKARPGEVCKNFAPFYHKESDWQYELEILTDGLQDEQLTFYAEACRG